MTTSDLITIVSVNFTLLLGMGGMIYWLISRLDADVKSINDHMKSITNRMDNHAIRIDQLYAMFVQLVKDRK